MQNNYSTQAHGFFKRHLIECIGAVMVTGAVCLFLSIGKDAPEPNAKLVPASELQIDREAEQRMQREIQRDEAITKIHEIIQSRSGEMKAAAERHRAATTREHFKQIVAVEIGESRKRISNYASYLCGYEATWEIGTALAESRLDARMLELNRAYFFNDQQLIAKLMEFSDRQAKVFEGEILRINDEHAAQLSVLMDSLDGEVRRMIPAPALAPFQSDAQVKTAALQSQAGSIGLVLGTTMITGNSLGNLVKWITTRLGIKAGSKAVRIGSGPVGWVIGFTVGLAIEEGVTHYYLRPELEKQLNRYLDAVKQELLNNKDLPKQFADAHATWCRAIVSETND